MNYISKVYPWNIKQYTKGISNRKLKANYTCIRWPLKGISKVRTWPNKIAFKCVPKVNYMAYERSMQKYKQTLL